ncbi:MAG: hypothetical protein IPG23_20210 [Burkholderiales bacterium]|nr:hypothetical protein [Burkholderiales bacterium]
MNHSNYCARALAAWAILLPMLAHAVPPTLGRCQVLPSDHVLNARIDDLPVHPQSADFIRTISSGSRRLHLDLGISEDTQASDYYGIPYNIVSGSSMSWPTVHLDAGWPEESDCASAGHAAMQPCVGVVPALLPIPANPKVEGGISTDKSIYNDHHILVVDTDTCRLWESYNSYARSDGGWDILSSAQFDLSSNAMRPANWTSSDAAGLPVFPLLLRADEASAGAIPHALRFTIQSSKIRNAYVWPATHRTSNGDASLAKPPMGQRFRLKASYAIPANYTVQAKAILEAFKRYGLLIADGGSDMYIQGEPSRDWSEQTISQVQSLSHTEFEAVDMAPVMARPGFAATSARMPPAVSILGFAIGGSLAGPLDAQSLTVHISVSSADRGHAGQLYVLAFSPLITQTYALTATGWQVMDSGSMPSYADVSLGDHGIDVVNHINLALLPGLQVWVGYGRNVSDMVSGSKYARIYPVD